MTIHPYTCLFSGKPPQKTKRKMKLLLVLALLLALAFGLSVVLVYHSLPVDVEWSRYGPPSTGVDWKGAFRPAALELLRFHSPYDANAFFNPPWILFPLFLVALLSPALGAAVMYVLNLCCYLFTAARLKFNPLAFAILFLFSGMISNSMNGNIEGLLSLGFILPPQIGLFFVLVKPQFGIAVALFWMVEAYRDGGAKQVIKTFLPVSVAFVLSFILFGFWFAHAPDLTGAWWNSSIFPYGVPVGLILLGLAIGKRDLRFAIAASPFFVPYLVGHTWAVVWLGLLAFVPQWFPLRPFLLKGKHEATS